MCKKVYKKFKKSGWLNLVLIIMLIIGGNNQLVAGDQHWTTNGPFGGLVYSLKVDPMNPAIVYAGNTKGLWKSTDRGANWQLILSREIVKSESPLYIMQIDIANSNSNLLYVACVGGGLYKSNNAGASWAYTGVGTMSDIALSVAVDRFNPRYVYVATGYNGVYRSSDNGNTWNNIGLNGAYSSTNVVKFDPLAYQIIYAGGSDGVFKRGLYDTSWTSMSNGLPSPANIIAIEFDPLTASVIYAVSQYNGLYKTEDGGLNWVLKSSDIYSREPFYAQHMLAIDQSSPNIIYAATDSLRKSTDGGDTWNSIAGFSPNTRVVYYSVALEPDNSSTIYAGTMSGGILKSTDSGINWIYSNYGFNSPLLNAITLSSSQPNVIFAGGLGGDNGGGFFKSINYGESWQTNNNGFNDKIVNSILAIPSDSNILWAGTLSEGLFKSNDCGQNWMSVDFGAQPPFQAIHNLIVDPTNNNIIYATYGTEVYKTLDGGANWAVASSIPGWGILKLVIDPQNSKKLYATSEGFGGGIMKSIDGGITWSTFKSDNANCIAIDPVDSLTVYYGNIFKGLYKTSDGGQTWMRINSGLGWGSEVAFPLSIVVDPDNHNIVYTGLADVAANIGGKPGGVYRSVNGGLTWEPLMEGLTLTDVVELKLDSRSSTLYAAINMGGVWSYGLNPSIMPASIVEIVDVPNDQGKQLKLTWEASINDQVSSERPVTQYGVWRKIDTTSRKNTGNQQNGLILEGTKELFTLGEWYAIGSVLALQDSLYYYIAPTLADSNANGLNYSTFMITAHTQDPSIWSASIQDSAYSVDNIAPEAPYDLIGNIANNSVNLNWQAQFSYPDFSYFAIYRDTISNFIPNDNNRIATSIYQNFTDNTVPPDQNYMYVISAFDFNGNESSYSNEESVIFVGVDEWLNNPNFSLSQNYPNPFSKKTIIHITTTVVSDKNTTITIYNFNGQKIKTLVNKRLSAGTHQVVWDGTDDFGSKVTNGIYFYKMEYGDQYTDFKKMILMK